MTISRLDKICLFYSNFSGKNPDAWLTNSSANIDFAPYLRKAILVIISSIFAVFSPRCPWFILQDYDKEYL